MSSSSVRVRQRHQQRADRLAYRVAWSVQPESYCQFELHTDAASSPIANVLRVCGGKRVILALGIDSDPMHRFSDRQLQRSIKPAEENSLIIAAASVNRNDVIALGQEFQTTRFVEPMACQVQR